MITITDLTISYEFWSAWGYGGAVHFTYIPAGSCFIWTNDLLDTRAFTPYSHEGRVDPITFGSRRYQHDYSH